MRDPRGVLEEFGVDLPDETRITVWDSTAELRYLVVPQRPAGTDGWDEATLAQLVSRNAMIGTEREGPPHAVRAGSNRVIGVENGSPSMIPTRKSSVR